MAHDRAIFFLGAHQPELALILLGHCTYSEAYILTPNRAIMHEVAITQNIIDICEKTARRQGATTVRSVTVAIGELSGVVPEAVEFCFEACSQGTLLENASLLIERIPGRGRCLACQIEFPLDNQRFTCPACGEFAPRRIMGEELSVKQMEID